MADEHLEFDIRLDRTRRAQGRNGGRRGIRRQCRPWLRARLTGDMPQLTAPGPAPWSRPGQGAAVPPGAGETPPGEVRP